VTVKQPGRPDRQPRSTREQLWTPLAAPLGLGPLLFAALLLGLPSAALGQEAPKLGAAKPAPLKTLGSGEKPGPGKPTLGKPGPGEPKAKPKPSVQELLAELSAPDWNRREAATQGLIAAGAEGRRAARQGLRSPDPEVRLRCLYIFRRPEILSQRLLSVMVESAAQDKSITAYKSLRDQGELFRKPLIRKLFELATARNSKSQLQQLGTALDILSEIAKPEDTKALAQILTKNLQESTEHGVGKPLGMCLALFRRLPKEAVLREVGKVLDAAPESPNAYQAMQAITILAETCGHAAIPTILRGLGHKESRTRIWAARSLRWLDPTDKELRQLLPLLKDEDDDAVIITLDLLGDFAVKSTVDRVIRLLDHESEQVKFHAIRALGLIAHPAAAKPLRKILWPEIEGKAMERRRKMRELAPLRGRAAWALAKIGKSSTAELIALLSAKQGIEREICLALGINGSKEAIAKLSRSLSEGRSTVRASAAAGLALVRHDPAASIALYEVARTVGTEAPVAIACMLALRDQNTAVARKKLLELVNCKSTVVQSTAVRYCGELEIREAAPRLVRLMATSRRRGGLLSTITTALGNLGGEDAIKELIKIHDATPKSGRANIARALGRAGRREYMKPIIAATKKSSERSTGGLPQNSLNALGIDYLYGGRWADAILTFRRMQWVDPAASFSAYNTACAYGLQSKPKPALWHLRRSVSKAFTKMSASWPNWRHMSCDQDLKVLWAEDHFRAMIRRLRIDEQLKLGTP